jgi:hypothetical protein
MRAREANHANAGRAPQQSEDKPGRNQHAAAEGVHETVTGEAPGVAHYGETMPVAAQPG